MKGVIHILTKATDLTVVVEDRPGVLAKATEAIAKAGVNIDGFSGSSDCGDLHLLFTTDSKSAKKALEGAGFKVKGENEVVLVDLADRPGTAAAEFRKIAQHEINIELVYLATNNRLVIGGDRIQPIWDALSSETATATR